jgi:tripartite-type tricarboxylate transporter receptor subunit TctC
MLASANPISALRRAALAAVLSSALGPAMAQAPAVFPDRPLRIVVPYNAGAAADTITRMLAEAMSQSMKQHVIVENRPGAGGNIGTQAAARSAADGYTLVLAATPNFAINQTLYSKTVLGFDPDTDFRPVGLAMSAPNVIVTGNSAPFGDLQGLIAYGRANPGKLSYATYATGSTGHLAGTMLSTQTGVEMVHVATKDPLSMAAGDHIQVAIVPPTATLPLVRSGKLRALAVTSERRLSIASEIPTVQEGGLAGFDATVWYGYAVPRQTPDAIVRVLEQELGRAVN